MAGGELLRWVVKGPGVVERGPDELTGGGQQTPVTGPEEVHPARLDPAAKLGIDAEQESHPTYPQPRHDRRSDKHSASSPMPPAVEMGEQIEGHRAMLDFLCTMPAQQIQHGGIRSGGVQRG